MWKKYVKRVAITVALLIAIVATVLVLLWDQRPTLEEIDWAPPAAASAATPDVVTVTWLGVTTLLFDDGETQILIDGFFSRPGIADYLLRRPVDIDAPQINYAMNEFRIRRLAAIIPIHSHFDHAMDVGAVANRSEAMVLGSASTANLARGAGVPEDQITIAEEAVDYEFGNFKVTLLDSPHAPIGWRGSVPMDGTIDEPMELPQPVSAWRMGGAYTVVIEHPQGTALVQGSSAFKKYELDDLSVDVVFLGASQLRSLGRNYAELYWQHTVTATGAHSVYPIHFDDFTKPFGVVELPPRIIDNIVNTANWFDEFRNRWDSDTSLFMPEFGKPIAIYAQPASET